MFEAPLNSLRNPPFFLFNLQYLQDQRGWRDKGRRGRGKKGVGEGKDHVSGALWGIVRGKGEKGAVEKLIYLFPNAFISGQASGSNAFNCVNNSIGRDNAGVPDNKTALLDCFKRSTRLFVRAAKAFFK